MAFWSLIGTTLIAKTRSTPVQQCSLSTCSTLVAVMGNLKFVKKVLMLRRTNDILWNLPRLHVCSEINDVRQLIAKQESKNGVSHKSFRTHSSSTSEPWIITDGNSFAEFKTTTNFIWSLILHLKISHTQSVILYILIYCTNQDIATFPKSMNNRKSMCSSSSSLNSYIFTGRDTSLVLTPSIPHLSSANRCS